MKTLARLWRNESGQDAAEYALLIVLVAVSIISSVAGLRSAIGTVYTSQTAMLSKNDSPAVTPGSTPPPSSTPTPTKPGNGGGNGGGNGKGPKK